MTQTGFSLSLPNGDTFTVTSGVEFHHRTQTNFLFQGVGTAATFVEQWFDDTGGQDNRGDSYMQAVYAGNGAGVHTIVVSFTQHEGSTDSWGSASASDGPITKLQTLNRALTTVKIDSREENVAELSIGEYASSGPYGPIPAVVLESDLGFDPNQESSQFGGSITFAEATDLADPIDNRETRAEE